MNYDRDLAAEELADLQLSRRLRDAAHRALMRLPPGHPDEPDDDDQPTDDDGNE
jgi:hypothetical protein